MARLAAQQPLPFPLMPARRAASKCARRRKAMLRLLGCAKACLSGLPPLLRMPGLTACPVGVLLQGRP